MKKAGRDIFADWGGFGGAAVLSEVWEAGVTGYVLGAGLIVAIGAQNAFVLRQGLLRRHVFIVCLICSSADTALIFLGVAGFAAAVDRAAWLVAAATVGGAVFLFIYGAAAFRRAAKPAAMTVAGDGAKGLPQAAGVCLALTFLNPHVYLDTVVFLGGLSTKYHGAARWVYGASAALASFVWFFSLGYGARLLTPVFANPAAWRALDIVIGCMMWGIGLSLILRPFRL